MPKAVQQQDWDQDEARLHFTELRLNIDPGGNPEHERTEEKIHREDVRRTVLSWRIRLDDLRFSDLVPRQDHLCRLFVE
jgi:hypothetical protein